MLANSALPSAICHRSCTQHARDADTKCWALAEPVLEGDRSELAFNGVSTLSVYKSSTKHHIAPSLALNRLLLS